MLTTLGIALFNFMLFSCAAENEVPVLIWGAGVSQVAEKYAGIKILSNEYFYDQYLEKLTSYENPPLMIFVEQALSTEDFRNPYVYPFLRKIIQAESVLYLPHVKEPEESFKKLVSVAGYEMIQSTSTVTQRNSSDSDGGIILMHRLDDAKSGEDRTDLLSDHDKYIINTSKSFKMAHPDAIFVLTAHQPSWIQPDSSVFHSRKLFAEEPEQTESSTPKVENVYGYSPTGLIYSRSAPILFDKTANTETELLFKGNPITGDKAALMVPFEIDGKVLKANFHFNATNTMWKLEDAVLEGTYITGDKRKIIMKPTSFIGSSKGFSFHTPKNVSFVNEDKSLEMRFRGFQVEYFFGQKKLGFSPADDTVYFFTIPILSGLFVTGLLTTIVLFGLSMIFDIKTMDQFDDPKGKTVTINAAE